MSKVITATDGETPSAFRLFGAILGNVFAKAREVYEDCRSWASKKKAKIAKALQKARSKTKGYFSKAAEKLAKKQAKIAAKKEKAKAKAERKTAYNNMLLNNLRDLENNAA